MIPGMGFVMIVSVLRKSVRGGEIADAVHCSLSSLWFQSCQVLKQRVYLIRERVKGFAGRKRLICDIGNKVYI